MPIESVNSNLLNNYTTFGQTTVPGAMMPAKNEKKPVSPAGLCALSAVASAAVTAAVAGGIIYAIKHGKVNDVTQTIKRNYILEHVDDMTGEIIQKSTYFDGSSEIIEDVIKWPNGVFKRVSEYFPECYISHFRDYNVRGVLYRQSIYTEDGVEFKRIWGEAGKSYKR